MLLLDESAARRMLPRSINRAPLPGCPEVIVRHHFMTCRDNVNRMDAHVRLRESKTQSRAAMTGMAKQHEDHKALEKQLIRAS